MQSRNQRLRHTQEKLPQIPNGSYLPGFDNRGRRKELLQIGAGAKSFLSGTLDNYSADFIIHLDSLQDFIQLIAHPDAECVERLWPVQRDPRDGSILLI